MENIFNKRSWEYYSDWCVGMGVFDKSRVGVANLLSRELEIGYNFFIF